MSISRIQSQVIYQAIKSVDRVSWPKEKSRPRFCSIIRDRKRIVRKIGRKHVTLLLVITQSNHVIMPGQQPPTTRHGHHRCCDQSNKAWVHHLEPASATTRRTDPSTRQRRICLRIVQSKFHLGVGLHQTWACTNAQTALIIDQQSIACCNQLWQIWVAHLDAGRVIVG